MMTTEHLAGFSAGAICDRLDNDGNLDAADLAELLAKWGGDGNDNGIPDECPGG